jgi:hypothetical protein
MRAPGPTSQRRTPDASPLLPKKTVGRAIPANLTIDTDKPRSLARDSVILLRPALPALAVKDALDGE